jgi:hypothetical protein
MHGCACKMYMQYLKSQVGCHQDCQLQNIVGDACLRELKSQPSFQTPQRYWVSNSMLETHYVRAHLLNSLAAHQVQP